MYEYNTGEKPVTVDLGEYEVKVEEESDESEEASEVFFEGF